MKVKIKRLHPKAVIPFKTYERDFCFDCVAVSEEEIVPNVWKYGLGFAVEIADIQKDVIQKDVIRSIDIRPRSSIYKTGMVLSNCIGTVDEPYRGEISAIFYHVLPNMNRYKVGDKICQLTLGTTTNIEFEEVDDLTPTDRGCNGYGSTGN